MSNQLPDPRGMYPQFYNPSAPTKKAYTGRELYHLWQSKLEQAGCYNDDWSDLEETDKRAWNALAVELFF